LASCLPLLLQLPVFISLFYMLRSDLKKHICGTQLVQHYNTLHHPGVASISHLPSSYIEKTTCNAVAPHSAKFLFLPDITNKATGVALVVLILLYVGSQVGSTLIATAAADPTQRRLMLLLPVVFVVILYRYPAGLLVYWITTNMWTIGQQLVIRRYMGSPAAPPDRGGGGSGSGGGGGSPNGKPEAPKGGPAKAEPALAGVSAQGRGAPPPRPPRKRKKRSGRRR
jgi:YidC/Oxa1 family membrane protein insertase